MNKKFILIGHKKQHGKDTFAKMLKEHLGNAEILSFADPMREILAEALGMTVTELKENYSNDDKLRGVMQRFGSGKMIEYFGEQVWRDVLLRRAEKLDCEYIIVPDFRFHREAIEGAINVHVYNSRVPSNDTHESEIDLNDFGFDYVIHNSGSLDDLRQYVKNFCSLCELNKDDRVDELVELIAENERMKEFIERVCGSIETTYADMCQYASDKQEIMFAEDELDLPNSFRVFKCE